MKIFIYFSSVGGFLGWRDENLRLDENGDENGEGVNDGTSWRLIGRTKWSREYEDEQSICDRCFWGVGNCGGAGF
jgi:hypothetical protein